MQGNTEFPFVGIKLNLLCFIVAFIEKARCDILLFVVFAKYLRKGGETNRNGHEESKGFREK